MGETIDALLPGADGGLVLAPLGVGGHADHVLVRTAAERCGRPVVYYSDFPYNQHADPDARFTARHGLVARDWERGIDRKAELIRGYGTQADAMFPEGRVPRTPEVYLLPESADTTVRSRPTHPAPTRGARGIRTPRGVS